jgi:hypothetical protein
MDGYFSAAIPAMHLSSGSVYNGRTAAEEQLFVVDNFLSED